MTRSVRLPHRPAWSAEAIEQERTVREVALLVDPDNPRAERAEAELRGRDGYGRVEDADLLVVLGGDGFMLRALHLALISSRDVALYGMNRGTVGLLMNEYRADNLPARLALAEPTSLHPLELVATDRSGQHHEELAVNEVALLRSSPHSAALRLSVDGDVVLEQLVGDGIIIATPAGSTAYNRSAGGPILPLGAALVSVTPIAAVNPRGWRGALLPASAELSIEVTDPEQRPVAATVDRRQIDDIHRVQVHSRLDITRTLLFDPDHGLEHRILREQFRP